MQKKCLNNMINANGIKDNNTQYDQWSIHKLWDKYDYNYSWIKGYKWINNYEQMAD